MGQYNFQEPSTSAKTTDHIQNNFSVPLAERMRPRKLENYVGQDHVLGKHSMLLQLLMKNEILNIILWGPPGCGKVITKNNI